MWVSCYQVLCRMLVFKHGDRAELTWVCVQCHINTREGDAQHGIYHAPAWVSELDMVINSQRMPASSAVLWHKEPRRISLSGHACMRRIACTSLAVQAHLIKFDHPHSQSSKSRFCMPRKTKRPCTHSRVTGPYQCGSQTPRNLEDRDLRTAARIADCDGCLAPALVGWCTHTCADKMHKDARRPPCTKKASCKGRAPLQGMQWWSHRSPRKEPAGPWGPLLRENDAQRWGGQCGQRWSGRRGPFLMC